MSTIQAVDGVSPDLLAGLQSVDTKLQSGSLVAPTGGFGELFSKGLTRVNERLLADQANLQKLAVGDVQNLHQVMIGLEESRLSFQLMLQVRNRLLESYQDIMKMQI